MQKKHICLVTGGTRGIGAAISKALKNDGNTVIANYKENHEAATAFQNETGINTISWDVSDDQLCKCNLESIKNKYGTVDILVHNAGIMLKAPLHKMTLDEWNEVIQTNLMSCFYLVSNLIHGMKDKKFGRVIFISSINAEKGEASQTNYCASKAGVIGFMKSLSMEYLDKGITSNAIAPAYINTNKETVNDPLFNGVVRRFGKPVDVARCVSFLASEEASYITGEVLRVSGGEY